MPALVPSALRRENASLYYAMLVRQAKFMHFHWNIQITDIDPARFDRDLRPLLESNPKFNRVYLDTANRRAHVSTTEASYLYVRDWIDAKLAILPVDYQPTRATPVGRNKESNQTAATKYSQLFSEVATQASDNSSFYPSTIKTTRSHAWTRRPPMRIEYDVTATAFPPLPKKSSTVDTPITQAVTIESNNLQHAIDKAVQQVKAGHSSQADQFQAAIDAAIQQAEQTNAEKLKAFTTTMDARMTALKASLNTIVEKVIASTYESLHNSDTFVTKQDHIRLQTDVNGINTKLDALIQLIHNNYEPESFTDHDDEYPRPHIPHGNAKTAAPVPRPLLPATPPPLIPRWRGAKNKYDPTTHSTHGIFSPPNNTDLHY
jgi:hypothetical protein